MLPSDEDPSTNLCFVAGVPGDWPAPHVEQQAPDQQRAEPAHQQDEGQVQLRQRRVQGVQQGDLLLMLRPKLSSSNNSLFPIIQ